MKKYLPPTFLALSLLLIYLGTIAPGLTWANDGADGGDLITAAARGGIAHPTGYPTFLLFAQFFQLLPIGPLAFRTTLMSALAAIFSALMVYGILVWLRDSPVHGNWPAGLIGGISFGLSAMLWSQAVITEVYTLHTAFAGLVIFLTLWRPADFRRLWLELLLGLLLGLAIGNQLTSVFLIPPVILLRTWDGSKKLDWHALERVIGGLAAGLLVYLTLPLRAVTNPPVNWGNPSTFGQFEWLVTGQIYQPRLLSLPLSGILERTLTMANLLLHQYELPGLVLGLVGLVFAFKPNRLYFFTITNFLSFTLFAILYASFDSYIYLLPVFLSFALWIGLGAGSLLGGIERIHRITWASMFTILAIWFGVLVVARWPEVDASHDTRAEDFGAHAMQIIPPNAIVFVDSDQAIFGLWYFHYALHERADITVIATELLGWDWYVHTLQTTYPQLDWSATITWSPSITENNPGYPVCQVSYWDKEVIDCGTTIPISP